jgi:hypothetical protein
MLLVDLNSLLSSRVLYNGKVFVVLALLVCILHVCILHVCMNTVCWVLEDAVGN